MSWQEYFFTAFVICGLICVVGFLLAAWRDHGPRCGAIEALTPDRASAGYRSYMCSEREGHEPEDHRAVLDGVELARWSATKGKR